MAKILTTMSFNETHRRHSHRGWEQSSYISIYHWIIWMRSMMSRGVIHTWAYDDLATQIATTNEPSPAMDQNVHDILTDCLVLMHSDWLSLSLPLPISFLALVFSTHYRYLIYNLPYSGLDCFQALIRSVFRFSFSSSSLLTRKQTPRCQLAWSASSSRAHKLVKRADARDAWYG